MNTSIACAVAATLMLALPHMAEARSRAPVRQFVATVPCPSTGETGKKCPGWIVDHKVPLCAGGADDPQNMQWQAVAVSYLKDADERRLCRWLRP